MLFTAVELVAFTGALNQVDKYFANRGVNIYYSIGTVKIEFGAKKPTTGNTENQQTIDNLVK